MTAPTLTLNAVETVEAVFGAARVDTAATVLPLLAGRPVGAVFAVVR
ncbi:hypothetical protein GCM10029992_20950 [Glycomyces albus]